MLRTKGNQVEKICLTCGTPFLVRKIVIKNGHGKYCSHSCHYKSGAPRPGEKKGKTVSCKQCGSPFYVQRSLLLLGHGKFCSRKCKALACRKGDRRCIVCGKTFYCKGNPKGRPCCSRECGHKYRERRTYIRCVMCGKEVYKNRCHIAKKHKHYFCSLVCANKFQRRTKIEYTCLTCGNKFYWSPSRQKQANPKYCSIVCRNADTVHMTNAAVSACRALQKRIGPTSLEVNGRKVLEEMGFCKDVDFREQVLVAGRVLADVLFSDCNMIIQWDGDFWHGNPNKYIILSELQDKQSKKDKRQNDHLKKNEIHVLRFWESEVNNDPDFVKDRIAQARIHYFKCLGQKGIK